MGVTAEAETTALRLCSGVNHVIVASDGLWNFTTPAEITTSMRYSTDLARTALMAVLTAWALRRVLIVASGGGSSNAALPTTSPFSWFASRR